MRELTRYADTNQMSHVVERVSGTCHTAVGRLSLHPRLEQQIMATADGGANK